LIKDFLLKRVIEELVEACISFGEKDHFEEYIVIEVNSKQYYIDSDLKKALEKAETDFPDKLFHIIKIGNLQKLSKEIHYDWLF